MVSTKEQKGYTHIRLVGKEKDINNLLKDFKKEGIKYKEIEGI